MMLINKLTPEVKGKAFDPDWFLLRERFDEAERKLSLLDSHDQIIKEKEKEIDRLKAERDIFRAVLEGAEYGYLDALIVRPIEFAVAVGRKVAKLTKEMNQTISTLEKRVEELEEGIRKHTGASCPCATCKPLRALLPEVKP